MKQLQLYPLPSLGFNQKTLTTVFSLVNNTLENGKEAFAVDRRLYSEFSFLENDPLCNPMYTLKNPYSLRNCQQLEDDCALSDGKFPKHVYPSLMAAWRIDFRRPVTEFIPYPVGVVHLKVRAEICFRKRIGMKTLTADTNVGTLTADTNVCCGEASKYVDKNGACQSCSKGASPRLNGLFCEKCPAGYTPRGPLVTSYGCNPCAEDTFKSQEGNSDCLPCQIGHFTNGTVGSPFCIKR